MGHRDAERTRERTYEPPAGATLPDLTTVAGVSAMTRGELRETTITHLDTAGLDLLRAGVTLCRCEGGDEEGWRLRLPVDDRARDQAHDELRTPLTAGRRPPKQLRDLVLALTLDEPLVAVAEIHTLRDLVTLEADDRPACELASDRVAAERTLPGDAAAAHAEGVAQDAGDGPGDAGEGAGAQTWREWRVALLEGRPRLLDAVDTALLEAGAVRVERQDRLARVLGDAVPAPGPGPRRVKPGKPAARVLHHYLVEQHAALLAADLACRRREPSGVHDLRVALRRLRSTLATFRPLVERGVTEPLRAQMREISHLLGDGRDAEVVGASLQRLLDEEPADLRLGAARRTLGDERRASLRLARRTVDDTLASTDYVAMLRALRDLVAAPPWRAAAEADASLAIPRRIAQDLRRLRARMTAAGRAEGAAERARLLHEARKAAKRLRYACEASRAALGPEVVRLQEATQDLQDVLGEHHDTMTTRSVLRRLAGRADLHPGTAFTIGRLHAREEQHARLLEREVEEVWARLDRGKTIGWL